MAPTNTPYDRSNQKGQEITAVLNAMVKVVVDGPRLLAMLESMIDGGQAGNGDAANFAEMVTQGIYENTTDAKASYDQLLSAIGKMATDSSVTGTYSAAIQCTERHGII